MEHRPDQREDDDVHQTMDGMADGYTRDNPMVFGLWVLGLFGIGAAAFVLSALVAAH